MEKKLPKLTRKQMVFADEYIANGGNWTQASKKAYNIWGKWWSKTKKQATTTAEVIAVENLWKPSIQHYLQSYWDVAWSRIKELIHSEKESIALEAAKYTYDQVRGKSIQKIETKNETQTININMNYNDMTPKQIQEHIKKLMWQ